MITRFTVPNLQQCSIKLSNVASQKEKPELVLYNSRILSTYTERIIDNKEIWISKGRIACIKNNGTAKICRKKIVTSCYRNISYYCISPTCNKS